MFLLGVLVRLFLLVQAEAAPTENLTLYKKIEKECPSVAKFPRNETNEFTTCNSWTEIQAIDSIENDAKKDDVLCLIYYNAFVTYCKNTDALDISVPTNFNYNLNLLCDNLGVIGEDGEESAHLRTILKNKDGCRKTCGVFMNYVHPTCMKAYYYIHLNPPKVQQEQIKPKTIQLASHRLEQDVPVQHPAAAEASSTAKASVKQNLDTKASNTDAVNQASGLANDKPAVAKSVETVKAVQAENSAPAVAIIPPENGVKTQSVGVQVGSAEVQPSQSEPSKPASAPEPGTGTQGQAPPEYVEPPQSQSVKNREPAVAEAPEAAAPGNGAEAVISIDDETKNDDKKPAPPEEAGGIPVDEDSLGGGEDDEQDLQDNMIEKDNPPVKPAYSEPVAAPAKPDDSVSADTFSSVTVEEGDSYFFTFFMLLCVVFIVGYISYHNKQKILALILEGRRGKRQYRNRRPNSANYHKLDTNLEEAITSSTVNKNTNNVIY